MILKILSRNELFIRNKSVWILTDNWLNTIKARRGNCSEKEESSSKKDKKATASTKEDKSAAEKKGKEDTDDEGYKLTVSEFVKGLKNCDKVFTGNSFFKKISNFCCILIPCTNCIIHCNIWIKTCGFETKEYIMRIFLVNIQKTSRSWMKDVSLPLV